jgi:hypothetical protein
MVVGGGDEFLFCCFVLFLLFLNWVGRTLCRLYRLVVVETMDGWTKGRTEEEGQGLGGRGVEEEEGDEEEVVPGCVCVWVSRLMLKGNTFGSQHRSSRPPSPSYPLPVTDLVTSGVMRAAARFSHGAPTRAFTSSSSGSMLCVWDFV